jgi:signal peptidase I
MLGPRRRKLIDEIQGSKASDDAGLGALRKKAFRRTWLCPGAGFALLGRTILALATFAVSLCAMVSMAWAALNPSAGSLWTFVVLFLLAISLSVVEQIAVGRMAASAPGPRFLVDGFPFAVSGIGLAAAIVLIVILSSFGSLRLAGTGMTPTFEKGELFLYHKRSLDDRLVRGRVIVYKSSEHSAWGQAGMLVTARILAVPGDRLSIQVEQYLLNGEPGPAVGPTGQFAPVIAVPRTPETIQVPENCYFMIQDSPAGGFDSRVLSWAQRKDIVSTNLYYLRTHDLLKSVE